MQFRIFKIPVTVEPIFFFLVVLLGARRERVDLVAIWVGVVFVSILVHELGHAFAAQRYGLVSSIRLHSMGGLTEWSRTRALSNRQSIWISFAGPLAGFGLGGLVYLAHPVFQAAPDWRLSVVCGDLLWVNIGWSLLNLLPILPLDGGNVMRAAARAWLRRPDDYWPYLVSTATAGAGVAVALYKELWWTAMLASWFCYSSYRVLRTLRRTPLRRSARKRPTRCPRPSADYLRSLDENLS
jgi:stage IV sporulation protein FB